MSSLSGLDFGGILLGWLIVWLQSGMDRVGWWVGCGPWVSTFSRKLCWRLWETPVNLAPVSKNASIWSYE